MNYLLDRIPEYSKIIFDLSRGNLNSDCLNANKSRFNFTLNDLLESHRNYNDIHELSYFILFMESIDQANNLKFLIEFNSLNKNASYSSLISIYNKFISKNASSKIHACNYAITQIIDKISQEVTSCSISFKSLEQLKQELIKIAQKNHEIYRSSHFRHKYLVNLLKHNSIRLVDVLYDDVAIIYLIEFLEEEKVHDLLKFLLQTQDFTKQIQNLNQTIETTSLARGVFEEIQNDALVLYDAYISMQATRPIGFDKHIRKQIESNICQSFDTQSMTTHEIIQAYMDCFYLPMLIVYNVLEKIYLQKYLKSKLFSKFTYELLRYSSNTNELHVENRSNKFKNKIQSEEIDSLLRNDLLKTSSLSNKKLQIGRVDPLGHYFTDLDMQNYSSDEKPRLRKFVNFIRSSLSTQKVSHKIGTEEEKALKVAEMLIADVVDT